VIDGKCAWPDGCPFDCDDKICLIPKSQAGAFTPSEKDFPFGFPPPHFGVDWQDREARPGDYPQEGTKPISLRYVMADLDEMQMRIIASRLEDELGPWLDGSKGLTPDKAWEAMLSTLDSKHTPTGEE
jgi:hypothetical protein